MTKGANELQSRIGRRESRGRRRTFEPPPGYSNFVRELVCRVGSAM